MKLVTPEKTTLMEVTSVKRHEQGIVIQGKIMGTMPMKAILRPEELRSGLRFISPGLIWGLLRMLFQKSDQPTGK